MVHLELSIEKLWGAGDSEITPVADQTIVLVEHLSHVPGEEVSGYHRDLSRGG
jgi:hypothetical protein